MQRQSRPAVAETVEVVSVARSVAAGARAVRSRQGVAIAVTAGARGAVRSRAGGRGCGAESRGHGAVPSRQGLRGSRCGVECCVRLGAESRALRSARSRQGVAA